MCQVLDVSESGYYHHWTRGIARHRIHDMALLTQFAPYTKKLKANTTGRAYGKPYK